MMTDQYNCKIYKVLWGSKELLSSRNIFRYQSLHVQKEAAGIYIVLVETERGVSKILGRIDNTRLLNQRSKISWQLENFQNFKDLCGTLLEDSVFFACKFPTSIKISP